MLKRKKRISRILCALFAIMAIGAAGMITASAGNSVRSSGTYNFYNPGTQLTPCRSKENSSSMYMACTSSLSSIDSYFARAYGSTRDTTDRYYYEDKSHGNQYTFTKGTSCTMLNWVYEDGFPYGLIGAGSSRQTYMGYSWAPDNT